MKVTILGCGASGGCSTNWRQRRGGRFPNEPKNRRMRASILVEQGDTRILVDASPDLRQQCLTFGIDRVDAVLFTHDHADHTHGMDDLRGIYMAAAGPLRFLAARRPSDP